MERRKVPPRCVQVLNIHGEKTNIVGVTVVRKYALSLVPVVVQEVRILDLPARDVL